MVERHQVSIFYPAPTAIRAIAAIAAGTVVIVVDAEDRENEGDFVAAAEKVTPELVNFMITHGRGQLCMPILPEVSERLKLPPVVETNTAPLGTAYTIPVDHRSVQWLHALMAVAMVPSRLATMASSEPPGRSVRP